MMLQVHEVSRLRTDKLSFNQESTRLKRENEALLAKVASLVKLKEKHFESEFALKKEVGELKN